MLVRAWGCSFVRLWVADISFFGLLQERAEGLGLEIRVHGGRKEGFIPFDF